MILTTLLMLSLFSAAFVLAQDTTRAATSKGIGGKVVDATDKAVEVSTIDDFDFDETRIQSAVNELDDSTNKKRVGFAKVWRGFGGVNNAETGHLVALMLVTQSFEDKERTLGWLRVSDFGTYKLVKDIDASDFDSRVYYLASSRNEDLESLKSDGIGKLTLDESENYDGLTVWTVSLVVNENGEQTTWHGNIYGESPKVLKPTGDAEGIRAASDAANFRSKDNTGNGFLSRIRTFFSN